MLIKDRKHFVWGALLSVSFAVVLVIMFSPVFSGENALQAADRLFNSIAKVYSLHTLFLPPWLFF